MSGLSAVQCECLMVILNSVTTGYGILQKGGENWSLLLLLIADNENLTCMFIF